MKEHTPCKFPNCPCNQDCPCNVPDKEIVISGDGFWLKVVLIIITVCLVVALLASCRSHDPRLKKYDKDGLIKSSTPLYLDKKKSRKVKPVV